ncbi:MAG: SusC/RagA family TonB-linked outer membrane protein, partial [Tannerellaceae bacterium]|nr:SusC/RagA family TonB-linked outer membrane protein [Tannerellaceae bacterium]
PLDELWNRKKNRYRTKLFGNLAVVFHIIDGLDLRTQIGIDANLRQNKDYTPNNLNNISSRGEASFYNGQFIYWQEETYLSYNKLFEDKHRINATLGASWSKNEESNNGTGTVRDYDSNFFGYDRIQAGRTPESPNSDYNSWTMNSYFARGSYTYRDKYLATATLRVDGSSRFGANSKYGFFPSAGLGWVVSNEDFLKDNSLLNNLKLRASYGRTGNTEINVYQTLATMSTGTNLINGGRTAYNEMARMANPDLEWEKTDQFDVGFNISLFNYRLNLEMDYYIKNTKDLLLAKPIPFTTGFSSVMDNIGQVENKGIDFMLTTVNAETKDFRWESTLNFNYNKNTIRKLGENNEDIIMNPDIQGGNTILRVGESLGSFYGYIRYGTWGTDEVEEAAAAGAVPGEAKRSTDKHILGNGMPDFTGSFINKLFYKDFDFMLDLQFVTGVNAWQQFLHPMEDRTGIANGLRTILYEGWTETNQNTMVQQIRQQNYAGQNSMADSHWVCDGSYLRGSLIQLGYSLKNDLVKKWNINGLRLYFSINNAFLIKSKEYKAYDPESTTYGDRFGQNIISYQYPSSRTFTLGVNFSF